MEKLIELLNEWERERVNHNMKEFIPYGKSSFSDLSVERITSKKFWFIKWLVDNDKIDRSWFNYRNIYMSDYWSVDDIFLAFEKWEQGILYDFELEDTLLMLLSISDTPIEDLISYLK